MDGSQLPQEILIALASGQTILTGNQRAARTLRQRYDLHQRALGIPIWEPPAILAWDAWTASLWRQLLLVGQTTQLLLNHAQEHTLWRAVIAAAPETTSLRSADSLAAMAAEAFARLLAYRGEPRLRATAISADTRAFALWSTAFDRRCRTAGYLSAAQLASTLEAAARSGHFTLPANGYALIGFDFTTPAQQSLIDAISATGIPIAPLPIATPSVAPILFPAKTEPEELTIAARWIRQHLEQHPSAHIALIVPGLADHRARIDRTLRQTLAPEQQDITASPITPPFEFSLGVPLAQTPLVATALDLLRWATTPLPLPRISQLLLSPHFAEGTETNLRAEFDAYELRSIRTLRPELSIEALLRIAESSKRANRLPRLIAALKSLRRAIADNAFADGDTRPAADWADAIRSLLEASGWASTTNDSIEFQTRRKWESLLDELATLDFEGVRLTFADTLTTLTRLAGQTLFAPESRNAPVQVMSPYESAGSTFDAIWFLSTGDRSWPQYAGTSPLLSWQLQRELGMPGTDLAADAAQAAHITRRIAASAPIVHISYAEETADGHQRPSPTLASLTLTSFPELVHIPPPTPIPLDVFEDSAPIPPLPDRVIHGGASILQLQAACGFRAFSEKRLRATTLDNPETGMDAMERGNVVHVALQLFWNQVRTQAALKALTTDARRAILNASIDEALRKTAAPGTSSWDTAYLQVQRDRLFTLLDPWLLSELDRDVAFEVRASETDLKDVVIGPLHLNLRVDRIDSTEFGDVILDYKTGVATPKDWLTDRPDAPQLPLYAVLSATEQLAGVAFALVRPGKDRALIGYQTQPNILLKDAKPDLPLDAQRELWYDVLTQLATDFHSGKAQVNPKQYPQTCEYCTQRILCRLNPAQLDAAITDDEAEDANA